MLFYIYFQKFLILFEKLQWGFDVKICNNISRVFAKKTHIISTKQKHPKISKKKKHGKTCFPF